MDLTEVLKALRFSAERHRNQRRKDAEASPYINHPIEVTEILWRVGRVRDTGVIVAALLHDIIEDTKTNPGELRNLFGDEVLSLVLEVTDDKNLPKEERKRLQVEHASDLSVGAKQIKLADKICNVADVANSPPRNWSVERKREYLAWSEKVVAGLRGSNALLEKYFDGALEEGRKKMLKENPMGQDSHPVIYRSVTPKDGFSKKLYQYYTTMRPPGNVPYLVDNLWEWVRPEEFPDRRFSVFASPKYDLALKSGRCGGVVYKVRLNNDFKLCQLRKYEDSKFHPDCKELRNLLLKKLGQVWIDGKPFEKESIGRLWIPCLRKEEVENLFLTVPELKKIRDEIQEAIRYWRDVALIHKGEMVLPDENGEVFFEARDGYYLQTIDA